MKIYVCFTTYKDSFTAMIFCVHSYDFIGIITLDFSSLLKNHFECSFVSSECSLQSSECSLQSSNVYFEVPSEYLR